MQVVNQVLVLFLLIAIGYAARKVKALDDGALGHFSSFVVNITLPALILVSLLRPFGRELLGEAGTALILSSAVYGASFALAALYPFILGLKPKERGVHRYALVFSNVGFMGYPVVEAVLGSDALFNLAIYNIPFNFLAFSVGAWIIAKEGSRPLVLSWKTFINPSVLATVVGFILFLASVRLPEPLFRTMKMVGDITSPLSMIVIGAILARMDLRRVLGHWKNYVTVAVRLTLLPFLTGTLLYVLGFRGLAFALPTLMSSMPIAANTTILASVYEGDVESAGSLVFLSTLLCVATIPAVALIVGY